MVTSYVRKRTNYRNEKKHDLTPEIPVRLCYGSGWSNHFTRWISESAARPFSFN